MNAAFVVFAVAAAGGGQEPLIHPAGAPDEVAFSQIEVGTDSKIQEAGVKVFTNPEEWNDYLKKMDETNLKKPKIDWNKYQIVVATLQGSSDDGLALRMKRLHIDKPGSVDVEFQMSKLPRIEWPTRRGNVVAHQIYPYAILQTPKMDANWDIKVLSE